MFSSPIVVTTFSKAARGWKQPYSAYRVSGSRTSHLPKDYLRGSPSFPSCSVCRSSSSNIGLCRFRCPHSRSARRSADGVERGRGLGLVNCSQRVVLRQGTRLGQQARRQGQAAFTVQPLGQGPSRPSLRVMGWTGGSRSPPWIPRASPSPGRSRAKGMWLGATQPWRARELPDVSSGHDPEVAFLQFPLAACQLPELSGSGTTPLAQAATVWSKVKEPVQSDAQQLQLVSRGNRLLRDFVGAVEGVSLCQRHFSAAFVHPEAQIFVDGNVPPCDQKSKHVVQQL